MPVPAIFPALEIQVIKVPVIQAKGTINGPDVVCPNTQALFSMPEWPTTIFKWTLTSSLGATLDSTDQNNQIVINTKGAEVLTLTCKYTNTLLGCGGIATKQITVTAPDSIAGPGIACLGGTAFYSLFYGHSGNWVLALPNGTQQTWTNQTSVSPNFPVVGTYTLSVSGNSFCAPKPLTIKVGPKPAVPDSLIGVDRVCANTPTKYVAKNALPGTLFAWKAISGTASPANGPQTYASFTAAPNPSKIQVWRVTTDAAHCTSDTLTKMVYRPVVTAYISGIDSVCPSTQYTYKANYSEGETYAWSIAPANKGSVQGNANDSIVNILWNGLSGSATITLVVTKCGTTYTYTKNIWVRGVSALALNIPAAVCRDVPITATVTNPGITGNFTWDWGDVTPFSSTNPASHTYTATNPGAFSYTISVSVANAYGCAGTTLTGSQTIQVRPAPVVSISPAGPIQVCAGQPFPTLTATLQNGYEPTGTLQWWKVPNATPSVSCSGNPPSCTSYSVPGLGNYYAVAIGNTYGCSAISNYVSVITCIPDTAPPCGIIPAPTVSVSAVSNCGQVSLTGTTGGGGTPFSWNWVAVTPGATGVSQTNTTWNGNYAIAGPKEVSYNVYFTNGPDTCVKTVVKNTLVPLVPGTGRTITCNLNGLGYDVTLLDHSNYYPGYAPTGYNFVLNSTSHLTGTTPSYVATLGGGSSNTVQEIVTFPGGSCTSNDNFSLPALPVANFTWGPQPQACLIQTAVQFTNLSTGATISNAWTFPGPIPNSASDPYHTFQLPVSSFKAVTLKVTDKYGCTSTKTNNVGVVLSNLTGSLTVTGNNSCYGTPATLTYNPGGGAYPSLYAWKDNTTDLYNTTMPSIQVYDPGAYWVRGTNAAQCYKETNIIPVSFVTPPTAAISGDSLACLNVPYTLNGFAGPGVVYQWYLNGSAIPGATNESYTNPAIATGTFTYTLVVSATVGGTTCSSTSAAFKVTVNGLPVAPTITYAMVDCNSYTVKLIASSGVPGATYTWSSGGAGSSITVQGGGPYRAYLTDANGCRSYGDTYVPKDPRTYLWIFPSGCYAFCDKELPKTLVGPFAWFNHWAWWKNGSPDLAGTNHVSNYTVSIPGTYNLELDNGLCAATSDPMDVQSVSCPGCKEIQYKIAGWKVVNCEQNVAAPSTPCCYYLIDLSLQNVSGTDIGVSATSSNGTMVPGGTLVPAGSGGIYTFQLLPGVGFTGGLVTITITYTTYDKEGNPTRHICQDQVNLKGCSGPQYRMAAPNASISSSGGVAGAALVLIPNPAATSTRIDYKFAEGTKAGSLELFDLLGRIIASKQLREQVGNWTVDLTNLPGGTYLVILRQNGGETLQTKLVITH